MMSSKRLLVMAGVIFDSDGHISPSLAVARLLQADVRQIHIDVTQREESLDVI